MNFIELLQQEMIQEAATTRKMLSRVPAEQFDWQPHSKSMTLKHLASHLAEMPNWVTLAITADGLDFETHPYHLPDLKSTGELLDFFEASLRNGKDALANADETILTEEWILRSGENVLSQGTKYDIIRMAYCQIVHHRAQLGVYLRLLDIPIPGSYGPSADEIKF
jgi:uncharacterized damage-inducible protein DinB